jgi:hypothetical protein
VEEVRWKKNRVEVTARTTREGADAAARYGERQVFTAPRAIVTLPLGVLQARAGTPGAVIFNPGLGEKRRAIDRLAMGDIVKVVLCFRDRFWGDPVSSSRIAALDGRNLPDFGFLLTNDDVMPTWWGLAPMIAPVLVGWAGGHRAEAFLSACYSNASLGNRHPPRQSAIHNSQSAIEDIRDFEVKPLLGNNDPVTAETLKALARILQISPDALAGLLLASYLHDWSADPFSRGAYSYVPVGALSAQKILAEPLEQTLYFAGEATDTTHQQGTVHAALATGYRAAHQVLSGVVKPNGDVSGFPWRA